MMKGGTPLRHAWRANSATREEVSIDFRREIRWRDNGSTSLPRMAASSRPISPYRPQARPRHSAVAGDLRRQHVDARDRRLLCRRRLCRAGAGSVLAAWSRASISAIPRPNSTRRSAFTSASTPTSRSRIAADALKALRARPECNGKVGALGFCLGGKLAYLAAARTDVDCAVSYYGVGIEADLAEAGRSSARWCCISPSSTSSCPPEAREQIKAAFRHARRRVLSSIRAVDHAFARAGARDASTSRRR